MVTLVIGTGALMRFRVRQTTRERKRARRSMRQRVRVAREYAAFGVVYPEHARRLARRARNG